MCYDDRYNEWKGDMMSEKRKLDQETVDKMLRAHKNWAYPYLEDGPGYPADLS